MTDGPDYPPPTTPSGYPPPSGPWGGPPTGPATPPPPPSTPPPGSAWGPPPPPTGYLPPAQHGYGFAPGAAPIVAKQNGLATAALVCGIIGVLFAQFLLGPLAFVFGLVSHGQIRRSGGTQKGQGLAVAGVVLGVLDIALFVILLVYQDELRDFIDENSLGAVLAVLGLR
jgi:hypothetical protein